MVRHYNNGDNGSGLMERRVTRVVTAGTVTIPDWPVATTQVCSWTSSSCNRSSSASYRSRRLFFSDPPVPIARG